jgi:hypothetical protein
LYIFRVEEQAKQETNVKAGGKLGLFFNPKSRDSMFPRNVGCLLGIISQKPELFITTAVRTSKTLLKCIV